MLFVYVFLFRCVLRLYGKVFWGQPSFGGQLKISVGDLEPLTMGALPVGICIPPGGPMFTTRLRFFAFLGSCASQAYHKQNNNCQCGVSVGLC